VFLTTLDGRTSLAARVPVYQHDEEGLQGVAIDPGFAHNRWVYLFYAPPLDTPADDPATPGLNEGDAPAEGSAEDFERYEGETYLSRFKLDGGALDLASEQVILKVPADRGICCHVGGDIDFDAQGNLYLSTGDDTNPFASENYTPIDERPDRNPAYDAQRTAANTNDLRGKLLRIHVEPDGSYTIPPGNLFAPGTEKTRPEIYAMGFRNPFRFSVDKRTGWVHVGEYGPDAPTALPTRGPGGIVEFNQIRAAGNYGWPYCVGPNLAYRDYDFATAQSGPAFDCDAPVNDSPRNTGLRELPPAQPAWIHYDGGSVTYNGRTTDEFGNGGEAPMGGPVYDFDPALQSETKLPAFFDRHFFAGDWTRGWIKDIAIDAEGRPTAIHPFFDSMTMFAPMDMQFGPDGSLYVMDYGSGSYSGASADSAVYKINHVEGSRSPVAESSAAPTSGRAPLSVRFDAAGSRDPDGDAISYSWDFDGDGGEDSSAPAVTHVYDQDGTYTARLTVTDTAGKTGTASETIVVGNTQPTVEIELPENGAIFDYGERIDFRVKVTDPEDGEIDCAKVRVDTALGHNEHAHGDQSFTGCTGTLTVPAAWEPDTQYIFLVVNASYTDGGTPPLTGTASTVLQPRILQAEHFTNADDGVVVESASDPAGGGDRAIGGIADGDHVSYAPLNLLGIDRIDLRVNATLGGTVEARLDSPAGPLIGSVEVPRSDGWTTAPMPVSDPGGTHALFLVFRNPLAPELPVETSMLSLNFLQFAGPGVGPQADRVLVFSKTAGFRHSSIPNGIAAIRRLGAENGFAVDATEDAARFSDANLARYRAVIWLLTTGDVLDADQQAAFERYLNGGGGYAGVHAAADTEYEWPFYGHILGGAWFKSHPFNQDATIDVEDRTHPSTAHLPGRWTRHDEWYNFRANPRGDVHVLMALDESTYFPDPTFNNPLGRDAMGDHPIAWCKDVGAGRMWYTGGGHTEESYAAPDFLAHLRGGILSAAGMTPADCAA
jgi:glucose/arabinose dehydrogenase/PKD repeat protein